MADIELGVGLKSTGDEDRLAAAIANSLESAFKKLGPQLAKEFGDAFSRVARQNTKLDDVFDGAKRSADEFSDTMRKLSDRLADLASAGAAQRKAFGQGFDPSQLDAFESSLDQIIRLQDEINKKGGDPGLEAEFRNRTNLIRSELTATRTAAQQSTLAFREAANSRQRLETQASRERIALLNAEKARAVTQTQTSAAREVAIIRASSREQVALTQATAKQRAAAFELVGRAVRSTERVIRSAFDGTANVVSSAFTAIRRGAQNTTTNIRQSFSNSNRAIRQDFTNANSQITNSYRSSFRRNTSIVNNELAAQERGIKEFAREATEEVSSIGLGRIGAFATFGVLAGRALRGGFERAATLEDSERGLTALLGSVEEARALRQEILNVVTGTPFKLDQFAQAGAQLVAFNIEAEKVPRILTAIADSAAIRGGDAGQTIDSLVRVFGQISASGRLTGEDLNQLSEAGVPALQILGNAFGELSGDMRDLISDGAVPADRAIQVLTDGIIEGSDGVNGATAAFGGLAKQLGTTLRGSVGNFGAALDRLGATIITKFQPQLVGLVRAATEGVDVIASAFSSLGDAIVASPLFKVVGPFFDQLGPKIESAGDKIKPVLDFLAEGLVAFGTAAGAFAGIRRLPLLINAVTFALGRLLTPFNLLVATGVLVGGFVSRLVRDSPDLADALSALGNSVGRVATIISDLVSDGLDALATAIDQFVTPAVSKLSDLVLSVAVPALESLNRFIVNSVIPRARELAKAIRDDVLPFIGNALARAVEIGRDAFKTLSDFIRTKVVPVVGPILSRAVEIGKAAFEDIYDFLSGTLVPFIKSNLVPVLAGLGAAVGALALTGGNLPLAGLVGVGAGIGAALANDDIRNKVFAFFDDLVDGIRDRVSGLFEGDTLRRVGVGVLRVANTIGRVLGDALSDRRLLAAAAGIAAAAVALAGSFTLGFIEGIVDNIPELVDGIGDALRQAFVAIARDPAVAAAVVSAIIGATVIAKLVASFRRTGAVLAQAAAEGIASGAAPGVGGGSTGFINGLLGGPNAIRQAAAQAGQQYGQTLVTAIRNEARLIDQLGGQRQSNLRLGRVPGESFVDQNGRLAGQLRELRQESARLGTELGTAAVSGARLREGLGQITSGRIRQGFQQIGTAIRESGSAAAVAAGAVAGGAFMASFSAKAVLEAENAGDRIQGALGLAAAGAGVFAVTGSAPLAAGAVALGGIAAAFQQNAERAKEAAARAQEYLDVLREFGTLESSTAIESLGDKLFSDILEGSPKVQEALDAIGLGTASLATQIANGSLAERLGDVDAALQAIAGRPEDLRRLSPLAADLRAAGVSAGEASSTLLFLEQQVKAASDATSSYRREVDLTTQGLSGQQIVADQIAAALELNAGASRVARDATQAYRDKLNELNDVRIEGLKTKVDESKTALDEARGAADDALTALTNFLNGGDQQSGAGVVDEAVVSVAGLARDITGLSETAGATATEVQSKFNLAFQQVKDDAASVIAQGIEDGTVTDQATAASALQPLVDAAREQGTAGGEAALAAINEVLASFGSGEGSDLLGNVFDAEALVTEAQTALESAELNLEVGLTLKPELFALIAADAKAEFDRAGAESAQGFADGVEGSVAAKDAAKQMAEDALAAAEEALGISSPSTQFASLGGYSADGYAQGLNGSKAQVFQAAFSLGRFSMQGFRAGIAAGAAGVLAAARSVADRAAQIMRDALEVSSPSRVTFEIGEYFGEGFEEGILEGETGALSAAVRLANAALAPLNDAGRNAAKAIGKGFAEEGPSFAGSVRGALDDALRDAEFYANEFKFVGGQIASALFGQFGGNVGGRPGAVDLERAFLDILGNTDGFSAAIKKQTDQFGFYGLTFDRQFAVGRENRSAFLEAGQNIRDYAQTLIDGGRSASSAVAEAKVYRDQLLAVAKATGTPVAVFDEMIRQLGLADDQLNKFVVDVEKTTAAVKAATEAERRRIAAEEAAKAAEEKREKDEEDRRERERAEEEQRRQREAEEAERNRTASITAPVFRDLIVQTPTGDPEGVALFVANRVAFGIRR
jgi:tape measure domain-containing protein